VLVGPCVSGAEPEGFDDLLARPNVHWVGPKPYEELGSYLRVIDVGLTPYTPNAFNSASFPLKTLEYLAAGRGVVSTDLQATHWLDAGDLISVATGAQEFAACVSKQLALPRTPELAKRRRVFAAMHDWNKRVRTLAGLLGVGEVEERKSR
jgi:teichuronic acid biosynthesis glycosyltransferase TuaH